MIVVLYAVILAFAYKTITLKDLVGFLRETFKTTVSVMFIISGASLFAYILTSAQIPQQFAQFFLNTFHNKYTVLLVINLLLLVVGTFMDTSVAIVVLTPVLMPVITNFGIDPVHFGIIMILNLMIGLLTPPVGMVLFVLTSVSKVPLEKIVKATMPFMAILVVVLIAITYIPLLCYSCPNFCIEPYQAAKNKIRAHPRRGMGPDFIGRIHEILHEISFKSRI
jgi:tripartite ATP-independent transporter DctM subunit